MCKSAKYKFINAYFEEWENTLERAKDLTNSAKFHLEGITLILCHISALGRGRYPKLRDWESFKRVVKEYSGEYDILENIDVLLLFQFPHSKVADDQNYKKLENYEEIVIALESAIGDEQQIYGNDKLRYQKREDLLNILNNAKIPGFNPENFKRYIELFSSNQILYHFARCEAVHNRYFPLINIETKFPDLQRVYTSNHQIDSSVLIKILAGIIEKLKNECLANQKWPHQLPTDI